MSRRAALGPATGPAAVALTLVLTILVAANNTAGATSAPPQPLQVEAASLAQNGQQLMWQVGLGQPFAPGRLAHDRRALCLLIERAGSGIVTGQVCIAGPAKHSARPRLLYTKIAGGVSGRPRAVTATVTRSSSQELTATFLPSAIGLRYRPLRWQVISSLRGAACAPRSPGVAGCFELYPNPPSLLKLHTPVLVGCVAAGASLVYHGPARGKELALTFDDGPWDDPPTSDFLRVLEREGVPATFFEIGRQIDGYDPGGRAEKRMLSDGDMIGDHTWSHPNMAALRPSAQRIQLLRTIDAIRRATGGFTPCLWRPPYGSVTPSLVRLARSLGLLTIMWNVDPRDWALPGVNVIASNVVANATPGAIVIQHSGGGPRSQTLAALTREITALRNRGYRFVTLTQLLGLRLLYR